MRSPLASVTPRALIAVTCVPSRTRIFLIPEDCVSSHSATVGAYTMLSCSIRRPPAIDAAIVGDNQKRPAAGDPLARARWRRAPQPQVARIAAQRELRGRVVHHDDVAH